MKECSILKVQVLNKIALGPFINCGYKNLSEMYYIHNFSIIEWKDKHIKRIQGVIYDEKENYSLSISRNLKNKTHFCRKPIEN